MNTDKKVMQVVLYLGVVSCLAVNASDSDQKALKVEQTAGLRTASQAVLTARRQARAQLEADPTEEALDAFRQSLVALRDELTSVLPPENITVSADRSRINNAPSPETDPRRDSKSQQLIEKTITDLDKLKHRADERTKDLEAKKLDQHAKLAEHRTERIEKLRLNLIGFQDKSRTEQVQIVNELLERTKLRRVRDRDQTVTVGAGEVPLTSPAANASTPTLSTETRHRH